MSKEIEYTVTKKEHAFVQCSSCFGSGKKTRTFRGNKFVENCPRCKGSGREKITRQTEVSLLEALKELNLIK